MYVARVSGYAPMSAPIWHPIARLLAIGVLQPKVLHLSRLGDEAHRLGH
jgi:hypothetical protein